MGILQAEGMIVVVVAARPYPERYLFVFCIDLISIILDRDVTISIRVGYV